MPQKPVVLGFGAACKFQSLALRGCDLVQIEVFHRLSRFSTLPGAKSHHPKQAKGENLQIELGADFAIVIVQK